MKTTLYHRQLYHRPREILGYLAMGITYVPGAQSHLCLGEYHYHACVNRGRSEGREGQGKSYSL
jgi:hypothetical protein